MRAISKRTGKPLVNPQTLASNITYSEKVQSWGEYAGGSQYRSVGAAGRRLSLARIIYYDAIPDSGADPLIQAYWETVELLADTEIGFGAVRGRPRRQKRVDGLIAVDMLEGAFTKIFDVAILVAGDSDFVPMVNAVRRRGVMVVVSAAEWSLSEELRRSADRLWVIDPSVGAGFPHLSRPDKQVWFESQDGTVSLGDL